MKRKNCVALSYKDTFNFSLTDILICALANILKWFVVKNNIYDNH